MKAIYEALANFQQEVPVIHKGTQGYGYSYTDLPAIFEIINPLLKKHGLGFTQLVNDNKIDTILFHVGSGEEIKSSTTIPENVELAKMNQFQVLGSAITYIRRYALSSMLGLVTDKDTDASGDQKKQSKNDKPKVDVWMNQKQFEAIKSDPKKAIKALDFYDPKSAQEDGKIYAMKKDYRIALEKVVEDNI